MAHACGKYHTDGGFVYSYVNLIFDNRTTAPFIPKNLERIPFDQKWELFEPEIERLYITENVPLRDIIRIMKEKCDFDAV